MQVNVETRVGIFVLAAIGVFIYMGFRIGAFRFDRGRYNTYIVYFSDISGLSRKADVKIAGVKVGWVEKTTLLTENRLQAQAEITVSREFNLYQNAYAMVRQDGLLGPKYVELSPGDPLLPIVEPGQPLSRPSIEVVSIDQLLQQFKTIATNVEDVTQSLKTAIGGQQGSQILRETFDDLHTTAQKMASFSDVLERSFVRNEENIDVFLQLGNDIRRITDQIDQKILPNIYDSVDRVAGSVDRDFNRIATQLESTGEALKKHQSKRVTACVASAQLHKKLMKVKVFSGSL